MYYLVGGTTIPLIVLLWSRTFVMASLLLSKNIFLALVSYSYITDDQYVDDSGVVVAGFLFGIPIISFISDIVFVPLWLVIKKNAKQQKLYRQSQKDP